MNHERTFEKELSFSRAKEILRGIIDSVESSGYDSTEMCEKLKELGFSEQEVLNIGYGEEVVDDVFHPEGYQKQQQDAPKRGYWCGDYYIRTALPDGRQYRGRISIYADTEEELPQKENVKGIFWAARNHIGWMGGFTLANNEPWDKRSKPLSDDIYNGYIASRAYFPNAMFAVLMGDTDEDVSEFEHVIDGCVVSRDVRFCQDD